MAGGESREALRAVADDLCEELGYAPTETEAVEAEALLESAYGAGFLEMLSDEDEQLVSSVRRGLAELAASVGQPSSPTAAPKRAVVVALQGAELVMRGELMRDGGAQLGAMLPSFVFLVTLPMVEQDEALDLARRTAALVAGASGG